MTLLSIDISNTNFILVWEAVIVSYYALFLLGIYAKTSLRGNYHWQHVRPTTKYSWYNIQNKFM